jgi:hydroxymethylpyrimidine pyrophosphatase-like HAD family hydrolase
MHITIVATDFDGTISEGDQLHPDTGRALRRLREAGRFTVLVSGRPFEFLRYLQEREQAFDLIVAENGAVLYNPRTDEMRLPFGEVPSDLIDTLAKLGVPLWRGVAAAGTTVRYDDAIWVASRELGLAVHVETNRDAVMLLPPGASKGAGVLSLFKGEGLSPRNLLTFGDAENDRSLLQVAEVKVAVANAVDSLKAIADYVTPEAGPAGVAHFIEHYLLNGKAFDFAVRGAHHFDLGEADAIELNAHDLIDRNILVAGGSGYGKSWLASRLADGLISGGYQLLALDPAGDLRALRRHASCLCLGFGDEEMPPINLIVQLLAETDLSLVVNLSHMPTPQEQVLYTAGLMRRVIEVRRRFGKPHWIVIDEAQDLLGGQDNPARLPLLRVAAAPHVCLASWQPSRLDEVVLDRMDGFVLTHHQFAREVDCLSRVLTSRGLDASDLAERLDKLGEGQALMWGVMPSSGRTLIPLKFQVGPRTFPQIHYLHQYLEERVAPTKQFYFHDETRRTAPAGNLSELIDRMRTADLSVITYHFRREDFTRWMREVLHDETLVRWLDRMQTADLSGEALRSALIETLEQRHRTLGRLI